MSDLSLSETRIKMKPGVYEVSAEMKAPIERKTEYSFGTGRERMIKMHIDRIRS